MTAFGHFRGLEAALSVGHRGDESRARFIYLGMRPRGAIVSPFGLAVTATCVLYVCLL